MKKIQISQIDFPLPDFKNHVISKEKTILNWLINWINASLEKGIIQYGDLLPSKSDFARYFNVSAGTVQNAIRQAEDMNYFESRQSVGTIVKDPSLKNNSFEKMFSKKDKAVLEIKRYILQNKIKIGSKLPCIKDMASIINASDNTARLAFETLTLQDYLEFKLTKGNKSCWFYKKQVEFEPHEKTFSKDMGNVTLIKKTAEKMKKYIVQNYSVGDKILPNSEFAKLFNVSIRTVNEAAGILNEQKIILSRRGRYGTVYINDPQKAKRRSEREEKSVFMSHGRDNSLKNSYMYSWEKTLDALKKYILNNHEAGDKIPTMKQLSQILGVSSNTVRRSIKVLCLEGCLIAQRGKYGGVFILEMPQKESEAFTWLALNPSVVKTK